MTTREGSVHGFSERLYVPLRWWVQGVMLIATLWLAIVVAVPGTWAWGMTAAMLGLAALGFLSYGSAEIVVEDGRLRAGTASIDAKWLGEAFALTEDEARRTAGVDADARAFLLLRPYLPRAVKVMIEDPSDPAPYWLLATRRPTELVAALEALTAPSSSTSSDR